MALTLLSHEFMTWQLLANLDSEAVNEFHDNPTIKAMIVKAHSQAKTRWDIRSLQEREMEAIAAKVQDELEIGSAGVLAEIHNTDNLKTRHSECTPKCKEMGLAGLGGQTQSDSDHGSSVQSSAHGPGCDRISAGKIEIGVPGASQTLD